MIHIRRGERLGSRENQSSIPLFLLCVRGLLVCVSGIHRHEGETTAFIAVIGVIADKRHCCRGGSEGDELKELHDWRRMRRPWKVPLL